MSKRIHLQCGWNITNMYKLVPDMELTKAN